MTTVLVVFIAALLLSLITVPWAGRLGTRFGAVDLPGGRRVNTRPIPRSGGIGLVFSFTLALILCKISGTQIAALITASPEMLGFLGGGILVVGIGLFDDFHSLGPRIKFAAQIAGASLAFASGICIPLPDMIPLPAFHPVFSYGITVFWFLLLINAINLIDGVDGLASGIVFFASLVMVFLALLEQHYALALFFAALCGSILGFLRYNFNPATVFMGDGGSYFLGYTMAGLAVWGSAKTHLSSALLIPIVALGIPLMDTLLAPIRRWLRGKAMFQPDKGHIHHKLLARGYNTRRVVAILYAATVVLCLGCVLVVNLEDEYAGLVLVLLGGTMVVMMRQSGYMEYLAVDKVAGWFRDMYDSCGLSHDRRTFLDIQLEMNKAPDLATLWDLTGLAFARTGVDYAELFVRNGGPAPVSPSYAAPHLLTCDLAPGSTLTWQRDATMPDLCKHSMYKLELPLMTKGNRHLGVLWVVVDVEEKDPCAYFLRRMEQLRVALIRRMAALAHEETGKAGRQGDGRQGDRETGDGT
ncbi:MAG: MraY family glycosyltransferase [Desulfoplanes sp.]|nr:MraY family glycosyltransferase [Desulfoplanes sp.]